MVDTGSTLDRSHSASLSKSQTASSGMGMTAPEPTVIMVNSNRELELECTNLIGIFAGKETEENWEAREVSLQRLRGILRGDAPAMSAFAAHLKLLSEPISRTLHSLRTALVITCCTVVAELAVFTWTDLDPHVDMLLTHLFQISASTKKLVMSAAVNAIKSIIMINTFHPKQLVHFSTGITNKSQSLRQVTADCLRLFIERNVGSPALLQAIEKSASVETIEKIVKKGLKDANDKVREAARDAFYFYSIGWPDRAAKMLDSLELSVQKAIQRHKKPLATQMIVPRIYTLGSTSVSAAETDHLQVAYQSSTKSIENCPIPNHEIDSPQQTISSEAHSYNQDLQSSQYSSKSVSPNKPSNQSGKSAANTRAKSGPSISQPKVSKDLQILQQLESADTEDKLQGFYAILNTVQESSLMKQPIPFSSESLQNMRQSILSFYTIAEGEFLSSLLDLEYMDILLEAGLVDLTDIIMSALRASISVQSESDKKVVEKCLDLIKRSFNADELMDVLLSQIGAIHSSTEKLDSQSDGSNICKSFKVETLAAPLAQFLQSVAMLYTSNEDDADIKHYMTDAAKVGDMMKILVPIVHGSQAVPAATTFILGTLQCVHNISPQLFKCCMETFDYELANGVYIALGLPCSMTPSHLTDSLNSVVDKPLIEFDEVSLTPQKLVRDAHVNTPTFHSSQQDVCAKDVPPLPMPCSQHEGNDFMDHLDAENDNVFGDLSRIDSVLHDTSVMDSCMDEPSVQLSESANVLNETMPSGFADTSTIGPSYLSNSTSVYSTNAIVIHDNQRDTQDMSNTSADMSDDENISFTQVSGLVSANVQTSTPHTPSRQIPSVLDPFQAQNSACSENLIDLSCSAISGLVGAECEFPAPVLGHLERLVTDHDTPVKLQFNRRDQQNYLLSTGTPTPKRLKQHDELEQQINHLRVGTMTIGTTRRLMRISEADAKLPQQDSLKWGQWLGPLMLAIKEIVSFPQTDSDMLEQCLVLIKTLIKNQYVFFDGLEYEVIYLLLDCRSTGTAQVSGSAEAALDVMIEKLDPDALFEAFISILQRWDLHDENDPGRRVRLLLDYTSSVEYQPSPAASCLICLSRLIKSKFDMQDLNHTQRTNSLMNLASKAVNSDNLEIRKACIDLLVCVGDIIGDHIWTHVTPIFSEAQRKLLGVYIARSKRRTEQR
ncbi:suppressor of tub2 mutation [Batrachochytrium dendrobatidis]|nr:suppressor of tub2 mutation [Batrachochytrium dendrobatidis]